MTKMRWGNSEQPTGGTPRDNMWKSRPSLDPRTKGSPEPSSVTFGELVKEFITDPDFILNALRDRGLEPEDGTRLFDSDVAFIRWMFESCSKPEFRTEPMRPPLDWSKYSGRSIMERILARWKRQAEQEAGELTDSRILEKNEPDDEEN